MPPAAAEQRGCCEGVGILVITPALDILFRNFVDFLLLSSVKKRHCIALLWQATLKSAACWWRRMQTLARGTGAA